MTPQGKLVVKINHMVRMNIPQIDTNNKTTHVRSSPLH